MSRFAPLDAFLSSNPPISRIAAELKTLASAIAAYKEQEKILQDALRSRVEAEAAALFAKAEKQAGDVTFEADFVKLKASISKTVKWDNDKLQAIASSMDWGMAQRVFKIDFSVPESTFKAIPDPELIAKLEDARTVKYGELTIKPI